MISHGQKNLDIVIRLLLRKRGADLHELLALGPRQAAMTTMKRVERRGFKTSHIKMAGQLTRYYARKKIIGRTNTPKKRATR